MTPVLGVLVDDDKDSLPGIVDMLPHGVEDMAITCFKPAEDGNGFILRLRDWKGEAREISILIAKAIHSVIRTDLLEYELVSNDWSFDEAVNDYEMKELRFWTKPFEVHTFRIK
jgi:alpha-mannosidase